MDEFLEGLCDRCGQARREHRSVVSNMGTTGWFCTDGKGMGFVAMALWYKCKDRNGSDYEAVIIADALEDAGERFRAADQVWVRADGGALRFRVEGVTEQQGLSKPTVVKVLKDS